MGNDRCLLNLLPRTTYLNGVRNVASSPGLSRVASRRLHTFTTRLLFRISSLKRRISAVNGGVRHSRAIVRRLDRRVTLLGQRGFTGHDRRLDPSRNDLLSSLLSASVTTVRTRLGTIGPPTTPTRPHRRPGHTTLPTRFPHAIVHRRPRGARYTYNYRLRHVNRSIDRGLSCAPNIFAIRRRIHKG